MYVLPLSRTQRYVDTCLIQGKVIASPLVHKRYNDVTGSISDWKTFMLVGESPGMDDPRSFRVFEYCAVLPSEVSSSAFEVDSNLVKRDVQTESRGIKVRSK